MKKTKVLIVGYSLTIQSDGYVSELKNTEELEIEIFAIGGANWHATMYLLNLVDFNKYDHILFEIATCSRWLGKSHLELNRYEPILKRIIEYSLNKSHSIGFLNFTRTDVDHNVDPLLYAIKKLSIENNIPSSDPPLFENKFHEFLYDGIHTKNSGARIYAQSALNLIEKMNNDYHNKNNRQIKESHLTTFSESINSPSNIESYEFKKGGLNYLFYKLNESQKITINNNKKYKIWVRGFLLKIGPETGLIIVKKNNKEIFSKLCFDERSYYERYFPLFTQAIELLEMDEITLECQRAHQRPTPLKGDIYFDTQSVSISHYFISTEYPTP